MGNSLEQTPSTRGEAGWATLHLPEQGLSLWRAGLARGCFSALQNWAQGC